MHIAYEKFQREILQNGTPLTIKAGLVRVMGDFDALTPAQLFSKLSDVKDVGVHVHPERARIVFDEEAVEFTHATGTAFGILFATTTGTPILFVDFGQARVIADGLRMSFPEYLVELYLCLR